MTDHAATIRRYLQGHTTHRFPELLDAMAALDALLAELQQLQEQLEATERSLDEASNRAGNYYADLRECEEQRQQAIDALRDLDAAVYRDQDVSGIRFVLVRGDAVDAVRAALVKLGEKP